MRIEQRLLIVFESKTFYGAEPASA